MTHNAVVVLVYICFMSLQLDVNVLILFTFCFNLNSSTLIFFVYLQPFSISLLLRVFRSRARLVELEQITEARNAVRASYESLRRQRLEEFMAGFGVISLKLKEMYQMITLGGDAELELLDSLDPFSEGIVFSVRPPRKSWKNISNLSGGEKTLSSLALVFALHHYKPTPLYVMDEIDAALVSVWEWIACGGLLPYHTGIVHYHTVRWGGHL